MVSIFNLEELYRSTFGNQPYFLNPKDSQQPITQDIRFSGITENNRSKTSIDYTSKQIALNKKNLYGKDIWLPCEFWISTKKSIDLNCCTIGVNMVKTVIKTAVSERKGTVHEVFGIDDYKFNIKGFVIGKDRFFPEDQIAALNEVFETTEPVSLHGGYPEIWLDESCQVTVMTLDWPEVQGKTPWIRPFNLTCESSFIQDLIIP